MISPMQMFGFYMHTQFFISKLRMLPTNMRWRWLIWKNRIICCQIRITQFCCPLFTDLAGDKSQLIFQQGKLDLADKEAANLYMKNFTMDVCHNLSVRFNLRRWNWYIQYILHFWFSSQINKLTTLPKKTFSSFK